MRRWLELFAARRARSQRIDGSIEILLEEAELSPETIPLALAAFRIQRRAADHGIVMTFEQAFYRLRKRDRKGVFLRY